jgi:hypothetical protein
MKKIKYSLLKNILNTRKIKMKKDDEELTETYKDKVKRLNEKIYFLKKIMIFLLFFYCFVVIGGVTLQFLAYFLG